MLEVGGALRLRLEAKEISPLFASTLQPPASNIKKPDCIGLSENAVYGLVRYTRGAEKSPAREETPALKIEH